MPESEKPPDSLTPIALSFSGGGGRAAAFHLGTLSYLDHLDILKDVSIISSVSGGTFTAAKYALTLKTAPEAEDRHETFQRFFKDFYDFLADADLVPRALKRLAGKEPPKSPSPRRTIVKALADVYDETFMQGALFGTFWNGREIHLKEIVFNSTECKNGMAFRFYKSEQDHRIGNSRTWIEQEHAKEIRMADIVAASSDIPVGLEPLLFPQDFVWPKESPDLWVEVQKHLSKCGVSTTLPLVDGGVIDNQGMDGVMIAADPPTDKIKSLATIIQIEAATRFWNAVEGKPGDLDVDAADCCQLVQFPELLGLYIISDVPCPSEDIYEPDTKISLETLTRAGRTGFYLGVHLPRHLGSRLTLGRMNVVAWALLLLSGITAVQIIGYSAFVGPPYGGETWGLDALFFHAVPLLLAGFLFGSLLLLQVSLRRMFRQASPLAPNLWGSLKHLSINDLIYMTYARVSSTWALTSTIFLNRIRRLMYRVVYWTVATPVSQAGTPDEETEAIQKNVYGAYSRLAICDIQRLAQPVVDSDEVTDWPPHTPEMQQVAYRAAHMPTTFWLHKEQLDDLVVCGQITTCFSLLENLYNRRGEPRVDDLYKQVRQDWLTLQKDCRVFLSEASHKRDSSTEHASVRKAKA